MIKFCIFDLDGTLFNTLTTITHYVNLVLTRHNIATITEEECSSFIGHGAKILIRRALASKGIIDDVFAAELLAEYNAAYNADTLYLTSPYENIPELLYGLKNKGIRLGVLSNKPDVTTNIIINSFFPGLFDDVRGGREGVALKPSPDAVLMMMKDAEISSDEVMYIGDTGVDVETGKRANVGCTVGVCWGFRTVAELEEGGADVLAVTPTDIMAEVMRWQEK